MMRCKATFPLKNYVLSLCDYVFAMRRNALLHSLTPQRYVIALFSGLG